MGLQPKIRRPLVFLLFSILPDELARRAAWTLVRQGLATMTRNAVTVPTVGLDLL
jgi:hypothetical protein